MKAIGYLIKKILQYDRFMLFMILLYTAVSAVYPFIWVLTPSGILAMAESGQASGLMGWIAGAGALAVAASFLMSFLRGNYRMRMNHVRYHLIRDLMRYSLEMPYEDTLDAKKLDAIHLANDSVLNPQSGAGGIILTMLQLFGEILAAAGFIGLFSVLSWQVMVVILALVLLTFWLGQKSSRYEYQLWEDNLPVYRKRKILFQYAAEPGNQKDIRSYGLYGLLESYIQRYRKDSEILIRAASQKSFGMEAGIAVLDFLRDGFLYGWLIIQFMAGTIDASQFYLYTSGVISFVTLAQQSMMDAARIKKESAEFKNYQDVMSRASHEPEPPGDDGEKKPETAEKQSKGAYEKKAEEGPEICLKDVCFSYPGSQTMVLDHINLTIRPGEKLALVGENGSGKSTLIKLLCRLYRPTKGTITVDGRDIWTWEEKEYMAYVSAVFQDAMVFPFSLKENVCFERDGAVPAFGTWFETIMKQSGLDAIASGLKNGAETTMLRILDDDGVDLSGGQKQKLFLARALYRTESRILILDEPTAALDPLAERQMYEQYGAMTKQKTSIFVSHRLASTKFCDKIAFLWDGTIREFGSHEELLQKKGMYRELYEIQAKHYREQKGETI